MGIHRWGGVLIVSHGDSLRRGCFGVPLLEGWEGEVNERGKSIADKTAIQFRSIWAAPRQASTEERLIQKEKGKKGKRLVQENVYPLHRLISSGGRVQVPFLGQQDEEGECRTVGE